MSRRAENEPCLRRRRVAVAGRVCGSGEVEAGVVGEERGGREDGRAGHDIGSEEVEVCLSGRTLGKYDCCLFLWRRWMRVVGKVIV